MTVRIAWVVPGSLEQPTGGYIYDRLVIEGLSALGVRVNVLSIAPGEIPRIGECDAVVGDGLAIRELAELFERITLPRILLVHHLTSWESGHESLRAVEARALAACTGVVCTSRATAERLHREHGEPSAHVVQPGADRLPRATRRKNGDGVSVLAVGSLVARKRLEVVLQALGRMPPGALSLRIVGDPERDPDHARKLELAAPPAARFLGVLSDSELAVELASADALVLASSLEGYGMVLTEARHAGLPSIVSRSAALAEIVDGAHDVLVFEEGELESTLARFASDAALRERMREAARQSALSLPRWADTARKFRDVLSSLIG